MLRELVSVFGNSDPLRLMGDNFSRMLTLTNELNVTASKVFFTEVEGDGEVERKLLRDGDLEVNKLEQTIRRQIITHLSVPGNEADVPYCLLLMSLVKDVERLGDYAKNLSEIIKIHPKPLPLGRLFDELLLIRRSTENIFAALPGVFEDAEYDEALERIREGRRNSRQCERFIAEVGGSVMDAATTAALILGARYYKRTNGHLLNVYSGVVMPLDKVDYFDDSSAV